MFSAELGGKQVELMLKQCVWKLVQSIQNRLSQYKTAAILSRLPLGKQKHPEPDEVREEVSTKYYQ